MLQNPVKKALKERRLVLGSWLQSASPVNSEILARAGFKWLAADCEHGDIETGDLGNIFRAMQPFGTVPMVRVKENDTLEIRRALDLGAMGIIVPLVNSASDAAKAVAATKYPPAGIRGFAFQRANNWGCDFDDYVKNANDNIAVVVMIESKEAVENIDSILSTAGVDGVFIGPYDLSGSFGVPGETGSAIVVDSCKKVSQACARFEKSAGIHIVIPSEDAIRKSISGGFTFLALGMDTVFLSSGAKDALKKGVDLI